MLIQRENQGINNVNHLDELYININGDKFNPFGYINNDGLIKYGKKIIIVVPIDPEVWSMDASNKIEMKINFNAKSFIKIILHQSVILSLKDCLQQIHRRLSHFERYNYFHYVELLSLNDGSQLKTLFHIFQHDVILAKPLIQCGLTNWPRPYILIFIKKIVDRIPDLAYSICWSQGSWNEKYSVYEKLGEGSFAVVHRCEDMILNESYALKIIHASRVLSKKESVYDEIRIMQALCWSRSGDKTRNSNSPKSTGSFKNYHCLVEFYECFVNEKTGQIGLLLELATGGDLFEEINKKGSLYEDISCHYMNDICHALYYLHQKQIVHRDIKPENFLICPNFNGYNRLKLTDFGLAMEILPMQSLNVICGTPTYMAPEIFDRCYGLKIDIWAAGVILYAMLVGYPPFYNNYDNLNEMIASIKSGKFEFHEEHWSQITDNAKNLIQSLLVANINQRLSSGRILKHPWFLQLKDFNSDSSESVTLRNVKLSFRIISKVLCKFLSFKNQRIFSKK